LSNEGEFIKVSSGDSSIPFDRKIDCGRGHLLAVEMILRISTEAAVTIFGKMDINKFDQAIGHADEQGTRATAHQLGIAIRETSEHCEYCAISKIKKKNHPSVRLCKNDIFCYVRIWLKNHLTFNEIIISFHHLTK